MTAHQFVALGTHPRNPIGQKLLKKGTSESTSYLIHQSLQWQLGLTILIKLEMSQKRVTGQAYGLKPGTARCASQNRLSHAWIGIVFLPDALVGLHWFGKLGWSGLDLVAWWWVEESKSFGWLNLGRRLWQCRS